ncbi:cell wall hydrolase [Dorea sp. AF36-15AT]|uniref:cell wall hydrolase n=1 Tax=Dorea sp. AF36-15AT TaxID=2292041 RepID=UPI000E4A6B70|nr:cell wall hydrolase [Dorea sp. AF36-15AT]RHP11162.1 cell wall hydrolase [Dorea sp. AF36-15AT]
MFKLNNCRWRMVLAAIVALSIGFSSQAAEIDQIGTPESKAILTVGQVVKSASGIECIKKNKMQTGLQTKLTSKIEDTLKEEEERAEKLLASIIFCEAGNQSFTGQVAVGAVVLNRMANEAYPDTMEEVIYQPGQFCPAGSGWLDRVRSTDGYTESAMQAAEAALAGENPIGDCLYFDQGGYGYQIGAHYFH